MATLERGDVELAYDVEGTGERPMVFVHGWTCNRTYFAPQVEYFVARGCKAIVLDLRGHGESRAAEGATFTIADFADDVAAVIDHLGLDRPLVVGHSMGGITVLQLAAEHPEAVCAIAMVDPASLARNPAALAKRVAMLDAMKAGDQGPQREMVERRMFLPSDDPDLKAKIVDDMLAAPVHVAVAAMEGIHAFDGPAAAAKVSVPALHIAATYPLNPVNQLEGHLKGVVSGQTVGAGHFNHLFAPVQVNDMIDRFATLKAWGQHGKSR